MPPLAWLVRRLADSLVAQLPWWVLVSTGSYLLFEMGWGIFNFNDVPKAYDDLLIVSDAVPVALLYISTDSLTPSLWTGHQKRKGLPRSEGRQCRLDIAFLRLHLIFWKKADQAE